VYRTCDRALLRVLRMSDPIDRAARAGGGQAGNRGDHPMRCPKPVSGLPSPPCRLLSPDVRSVAPACARSELSFVRKPAAPGVSNPSASRTAPQGCSCETSEHCFWRGNPLASSFRFLLALPRSFPVLRFRSMDSFSRVTAFTLAPRPASRSSSSLSKPFSAAMEARCSR